jgi:excisionase family DNA binding protein
MKRKSTEGTVEGVPFDLGPLLDALADRVATKVLERLPSQNTARPLLLTVEQAALRLGRTVPAVQHLIRERRLPVVRFDRRVMLDERDILALIDASKN